MKNKKALLEVGELLAFQGLGRVQRQVMALLQKHPAGALSSYLRHELDVTPGTISASIRALEARGVVETTYWGAPETPTPYTLYIKLSELALKYYRGEW